MNFTAFERNLQGTGASRRLRISGKVPGIVFGAGEPKMIELDHNALYFALKKEAFHSSILSMELAGTTQRVLLRDFQMHPWKQQVLHVDFQRVDDTTRLRKKVPLHFSGEEESIAVKTDKCLVAHVSTEVEIECLATSLPERRGHRAQAGRRSRAGRRRCRASQEGRCQEGSGQEGCGEVILSAALALPGRTPLQAGFFVSGVLAISAARAGNCLLAVHRSSMSRAPFSAGSIAGSWPIVLAASSIT